MIVSELRHGFEVCRAVAFVTYKEWSAYRSHTLVSVFVGPVYFLTQYFIWTAVYSGDASFGGMELGQTIRYFGVSALIGYLTMDFADWNLQMLIRTGKFLTFALRPVHHRSFALYQKIGHRFLGFVFEFLPCFLIFMLVFGVDIVPANIGWTVLSVALAFLMRFYVDYIIGMSAFYLVRANGVRHIYALASAVFSGELFPLSFLPGPFQWVMMFLPFQYMSYVPAMVWTGSESIGELGLSIPAAVLFQGIATAAAALLSEVIYRASIKRFTAVGA